jgi:putative sugar O-methyltransferase
MPKITLCLDSEKVEKLKDYLGWVHENNSPIDKESSDYWIYHTDQIDIKYDQNRLYLSGESGFYFPRELTFINRLKNFFRFFPTKLSYFIFRAYQLIIPSLTSFLRTYSDAYESVWKLEPEMTTSLSVSSLGFSNLKNKKLKFRTIKGMKERWASSKTHILSDETIRAYFYLQLMEGTVPDLQWSTVCEIGSGTGNLASLFFPHFKTKLILIDLPKTLLFSYTNLSQLFPSAKILLPNEVEKVGFDLGKYDIIMITPDQISKIPDETVDLTVNISSMQEMKKETIESYFDLMDRIIKPNGYFFTSNRVEKIMSREPIRFSEYPWRAHTQTIFYQINPITRFTQLEPAFIRMEKYS